jgi:hypothetical protein
MTEATMQLRSPGNSQWMASARYQVRKEGVMQSTASRMGRPSRAQMERSRQEHTTLLVQALKHLHHPSRLSDSPLCELDCVRRRAATSRNCLYPRARLVIEAVKIAYETAWAELRGTGDAICLATIADALEGLTREASARKQGVSPAEITRRRREAVEILFEEIMRNLHGAEMP